MRTRKCEQFIYGGCGGNGNRFSYVDSCVDACISSEPTISPPPDVAEESIVYVMISSYDGNTDGLVADFTGDLMQILSNNGITDDVSVQILKISYTSDNEVILTVAVYSGDNAISGERIANLINQNKETFSLPISDAIIEDDVGAGGANSVSRGAVAGIVFGVIAGLIQI